MPFGWGREYLARGEDRNGECFPGQVLIVVDPPFVVCLGKEGSLRPGR